jgi:acyl-CoA synthetase (NDP forming)
MSDLSRLLRPKSIAVVGGGAWGRAVIEQCRKMGFAGSLHPVHPKEAEVGGVAAVKALAEVPVPIDACFIGVNRKLTVGIMGELAALNAGGAVCFAGGFAEASAEDPEAADLQKALLQGAGDMPFLGPNCYGFVNALDGALLWPDQHGCLPVAKGVAILTQSSNIAINLTMQQRSLPLAYVITCGNQAQTTQAEIALALLDDPRVTTIGLHIEGFGDLTAWQALARKAREKRVPLVALKVGKSLQAQAATISHTASLAGQDAGAQALLDRLGIVRVHSLTTLLETLKLLHVAGPLASNRIASISCSGGEASLIADTAVGRAVTFPPLNTRQSKDLREALGPLVALANPLDYNTYIWRDTDAMTRAWSAMIDPALALTFLIVDFPRPDRCDPKDWDCTIEAAIGARAKTGGKVAMVTTLPELLPEGVAARLLSGGVVPMHGLSEAVEAAEAAAKVTAFWSIPLGEVLLPGGPREAVTLTEAEAKGELVRFGLHVPKTGSDMDFPVVIKGEGLAHKSEAGAVAVGLKSQIEVEAAKARIGAASYLIEEMVIGGIAELLVGVVRDPAHGFVLTLGAGGTETEVWQDTTSLLLPVVPEDITTALAKTKVSKLLNGWRGKPKADIDAIVRAVLAVQDYVTAHAADVEEVEINPLICTPTDAVAADALIRRRR